MSTKMMQITGLITREVKKVPQNPMRLLDPIIPAIKLKIIQPAIKIGFNTTFNIVYKLRKLFFSFT